MSNSVRPSQSRLAHRWTPWLLSCAWIVSSSLAQPREATPDPNGVLIPGSTVLVLHSYHRGTIYTELQEKSIRAVLMSRPGSIRPRVIYEYLGYVPSARESRERLIEVLLERHRAHPPDLLLTTDTPALEFALEYADRIRPNLPIIFSAATGVDERIRRKHADVAGVVENIDVGGTLDLVLSLFPERTHCVGITDEFGYGQMLRERTDAAIAERGDRMTNEWLTPRTVKEIRSRLDELGPHEFVLFCINAHFSTSAQDVEHSALEEFCRMANAPVFVLFDMYLGDGAIGGKVTSAGYYGTTAAEFALRVLDGTPARNLPILHEDTTVYMFDWRVLNRWGVREARLPEGSDVHHRVPTLFQQYKWYIVGGAAVVATQTLTIALLALNRARLIRSRRALQVSKARYLLASAAATVYVWEWDLARNQAYFDPAILKHLGLVGANAPRTPADWWRLFHPDDLDAAKAASESQMRREADRVEREFRLRTASGEYHWFLVRGQHVSTDGENRIVGTIVDIQRLKLTEDALRESQSALELRVRERTAELSRTNAALRQEIAERELAQLALRNSEERLRQQSDALAHVSRVAMIGEMAAGLAHEINQPLTAAMNHAEASILAIKSQQSSPAELLSDLEAIAEQTSRVGQIVRNLRGFVGNRGERRMPVSAVALLNDVARLAEIELRKSSTRLDLRIDPDSPPIVANEVQLQQVVLNLIRNAIEAMHEVPGERRRIEVSTHYPGGDFLEISVSDCGRGVPHEARETIFDPFYTTRSDGLGLGLSISRTIVERHGGRLSYVDNAQGGATFIFSAPVAKDIALP